jgi:hypothetical protein
VISQTLWLLQPLQILFPTRIVILECFLKHSS